MKRILVLLLLLPLALAACGSLTETADTPRAQCERKAQDDPAVQRLAGDVTSGDYMVQYNARAAQREAVRIFLNRLWSADGWVSAREAANTCEVGVGVQSEDMARQVQFLLHKFGVGSRIEKSTFGKKQKQPFWKVRFARSADVVRFLEGVGPIFCKEEQCASALRISRRSKYQQYVCDQDVSWDSIT